MRFFEFATARKPLKLLSTKRFLKNAARYSRGGYPSFEKNLRDFISFKRDNPTTEFNGKDTPFRSGTPLRGYAHCHLVHGKAIVIYEVKDNHLYLYDVAEHSEFEGVAAVVMRDFIKGSSVTPLETTDTSSSGLSDDHKRSIDELLYEIAAEERGVLDDALGDDFAHLFDYIRMIVPESEATDDVIIQSFGGKDGFKKHIMGIMRNLGYK